MSLADELLADLEDAGLDGEEVSMEHEQELNGEDDGIEDIEDIDDLDSGQKGLDTNRVTYVARLSNSEQFIRVMKQITEILENSQPVSHAGPVEANPEYALIVESNNLAVEVDNEISIIHKFCRDNYMKRFPELESLVPTPIEYILTVKELGNDLERCKNNEVLQQILSNATIMVVSVTASTTQGKRLEEEEVSRILEACNMLENLVRAKAKILEYVEARMSFIAPNLTIIVGASTAAKLMGVAGGLIALTKMPACNILLLGSQKRSLSGFSSTAINPHTGFIHYSDLVQNVPPDLRRKASRLVAAKVTLAARVDSFHETADGATGYNLKEEIERKLEKWQEPPPVKQIKALPAPIDPPRKKRGGRRYRKMKERLGMTEMRKQANRMTFGEIEDEAYQQNLGFSLGQLGKKGAGRIRAAQVDNKTQVKVSKTLQQKINRSNKIGSTSTWGGKTSIKDRGSGTASSVAFTPLKGIEIVNPNASERKMEEEALADGKKSYFASGAAFVKVETPSF